MPDALPPAVRAPGCLSRDHQLRTGDLVGSAGYFGLGPAGIALSPLVVPDSRGLAGVNLGRAPRALEPRATERPDGAQWCGDLRRFGLEHRPPPPLGALDGGPSSRRPGSLALGSSERPGAFVRSGALLDGPLPSRRSSVVGSLHDGRPGSRNASRLSSGSRIGGQLKSVGITARLLTEPVALASLGSRDPFARRGRAAGALLVGALLANPGRSGDIAR